MTLGVALDTKRYTDTPLGYRLPATSELDQPYGMHFTPADLPLTDLAEGVQICVVAGEMFGTASPVHEAAAVHVYDVVLAADAAVELPVARSHRGFVMTVDGGGRVVTEAESGTLGSAGLAVFEAGPGSVEITAGPRGGRFLVGTGVPLNQPAFMLGGFCLSSAGRARDALSRYRSGQMHGLLTAP